MNTRRSDTSVGRDRVPSGRTGGALRVGNEAGAQKASGFRGLFEAYGSWLAPSFFGTSLVLVWIQCILYARYIWVDSGLTTVAINFARCACIVVLGFFAVRQAFPDHAQKVLGWVSALLMTAGSLLFFVQSLMPDLPFTLVAAVCSGVGLAWGGGMWINFYIRLGLREALFVAFGSLSLSTVFGVFIGFAAENTAFFISMLLPAVILAMYGQAQKTLDTREAEGWRAPAPDNVYALEPLSTTVRLMAGIALFSFVLGVSRGFPFGDSIKLSPLFQLIQHVSVTCAGIGVIWWTLVKGRRLKFSTLWQLQLAALSVGVILLSTLDPVLGEVGATLIAITNLFQVGFLWFVSYDVARHRAVPPYLIVGFFWFLHLFFRESGRLVMWWIGGTGGIEQMLVIAGMICLLAASVGLLLTDAIPRVRPLFAEVCVCSMRAAEIAELAKRADGGSVAGARGLEGSTGGEVVSSRGNEDCAGAFANAGGESSEFQSQQSAKHDRLAYVRENYGLTKRESEVLELLAEGRSSSYIAGELVLSEHTVRSYVKNIYQKLDVHSKQDLIDFMKAL